MKQVLEKMCKKLPSIQNGCQEFIDTYGDAIIAILVQEIDPARVNVFFILDVKLTKRNLTARLFKVCPMIHVCPSKELLQMWAQIPKGFMREEVEDKPSCPLCLLAVNQIYELIKENKTEVLVHCRLCLTV